VLVKCPNRFNSLYKAGMASAKLHDSTKAMAYFKQLLTIADSTNIDRPEITFARLFLKTCQK
jgi:hypothetical protein